MKLSKNRIAQMVGNTFFGATFIKKDGSLRKIHCRLGVKRYTKGGKLSYNQDYYNYLTVYDLQKKAYRTINVNQLLTINTRNKKFIVL